MKEKFSLIYDIVSILPTKKKLELYWSDYTFSKVPESQVFSYIQDTIMNNEAIVDNKNSNKFITILITLKDNKKIQVEITPPKARLNKKYLPHIEFSFCDEDSCLYRYFQEKKKIKRLLHVLDKYKSDIDETYFYDPMNSLNCYSDVSNRLWQKRNEPKTFTEDLLQLLRIEKKIENDDELAEDTNSNLAFNFVSRLFEKNGIDKISNLINSSNLIANASSGSMILSGKDVSLLLDLLKGKLNDYIKSIKKANIYDNQFNKVFK